jgi:hypothetical protein
LERLVFFFFFLGVKDPRIIETSLLFPPTILDPSCSIFSKATAFVLPFPSFLVSNRNAIKAALVWRIPDVYVFSFMNVRDAQWRMGWVSDCMCAKLPSAAWGQHFFRDSIGFVVSVCRHAEKHLQQSRVDSLRRDVLRPVMRIGPAAYGGQTWEYLDGLNNWQSGDSIEGAQLLSEGRQCVALVFGTPPPGLPFMVWACQG